MSVLNEFHDARKDERLVVLEGFHAVKHALRFKADIVRMVTDDASALMHLAQTLAPDTIGQLSGCEKIETNAFASLTPVPVESHVIAIAKRAQYTLNELLARPGYVVLLDQPTHPGNVGAVLRVAAARGIAGVIILGDIDPWQGSVVRGAAGLQYAVPVVHITDASAIMHSSRPLIALHEIGRPLTDQPLAENAILIFGSERRGISHALRQAAHETVTIPMQQGVSSLNLATSVAIVLYRAP